MRLKDMKSVIGSKLGKHFSYKGEGVWRFNFYDQNNGTMGFISLLDTLKTTRPQESQKMEFTIFDPCMQDFTELIEESK
jgi:phenolic acid decarboxylase